MTKKKFDLQAAVLIDLVSTLTARDYYPPDVYAEASEYVRAHIRPDTDPACAKLLEAILAFWQECSQ